MNSDTPPQSSESMAMQQAIDSAYIGVEHNHGGPFGACITQHDQVIAVAHNTVLRDNDPTCHAEMNAIRLAAKTLGRPHLNDCILYTTAEPCPMCLTAAYWARLAKIVYGVSHTEVARYGFDDAVFYQELALPPQQRQTPMVALDDHHACLAVFARWQVLARSLY